jgi:hypothetical protein
MAEHDDENISIIHGKEPYERSEKKQTDTKSIIKDIILEIEEHAIVFKREEIFERAARHKIPRAEADAVIDDLIAEGYLHYVVGTDKLLSRTVWRDYSPANEELFDF